MSRDIARLLVVAFVSAGLVTAAAKTWESLGSLNAGTSIEVVTKARVEKGEFVSSSADSLTIHTKLGEQKFPRQDVLRVMAHAHSRRVRNILIGAGIGAAVGLVTDQTLGTYLRNESNPPGARVVIWTLPIALGGGIGAALPSHSVIYRK